MSRAFILGGIAVVSLLVAFVSYETAQTAKKEAEQLRSVNDAQSAMIARSAFVFNQFNQITAAHEANRLARNARTGETVVEYREILRNVPVTDQLIPLSVAGGLCDYVTRLRSSPLRTTTGEPDSSRRDSAPTCELTYRQAVLWISPLLAALDEANAKLDAIRRADGVRNEPL